MISTIIHNIIKSDDKTSLYQTLYILHILLVEQHITENVAIFIDESKGSLILWCPKASDEFKGIILFI